MSPTSLRDRYETDPVAVARGHGDGRRLIAFVALAGIGILGAIAKPWGSSPGSAAIAAVEPSVPDESREPAGSPSSDPGEPFGPATLTTRIVDREFDGDLGAIIARLGERTGTWGIATGDSTPLGSPWATWSAVRPHRLDPTSSPECSGAELLPSGAIVAVTVPPGLGPGWSVSAATVGPSGRSVPVAAREIGTTIRNPAIAYLARTDGTGWGSGPFRFVVTGRRGSVALDACLLELPAAGTGTGIAQTLDLVPSVGGPSAYVAPPERRVTNVGP